MFNNTVNLSTGATFSTETVVVDGPTNRKTTRSSVDGTKELTIAHQSSNENPGFETQRTNVRVSRTIPVTESDRSVTAYAQLTISVPKTEVTAAALLEVVTELINFVRLGDNPSDTDAIDAVDFQSTVSRLYAGEP